MSEKQTPVTPDNRLAGQHLVDEALSPILLRGTSHLLRHLDGKGSLGPIIAFLQTAPGRLVGQTLPSGLSLLIGKFAKSSEANHVVRDFVVHVANELAEIASEKGDPTKVGKEDFEKALNNAHKATEEEIYHVDPHFRFFHRPECHLLPLTAARPFYQGKGQQQQPVQNAPVQVTISQALAQKLKGCPYCVLTDKGEIHVPERAAEEHVKTSSKDGKKLSPMDIIGAADSETQAQFFAWHASLTPDHIERVNKILKHLDSASELKALMSAHPDHRESVLVLLENSNESFQTAKMVELAAAETKKIGDAYKEFDQSLAQGLEPLTATTRKWKNKKRKKVTAWTYFARLYNPFWL